MEGYHCVIWKSAPRASGDGRIPKLLARIAISCSPRERGWSGWRSSVVMRSNVFPARG